MLYNMIVLPEESVGVNWLLFCVARQPNSSLWDKTKPPDGAKPAHTPTDILLCDITPEYYIHQFV